MEKKLANKLENQSVEKIMNICKELDLQVKTDAPLEKNTYLSAWHKSSPVTAAE